MKAIAKILKGGNAKATVAYLLDPNAKAKRELMPAKMMTASDSLEQVGERVAEVFGEGISPKALSSRNEAEIVAQLEATSSTLRRRGKLTRHVVISAEFEDGEILSDEQINQKLKLAAEDFIDKYAPGSKFIAVIHRDSSQPHVHIEIENYDHAVGENGGEPMRLDWSSTEVEEMQLIKWTDQFEMGKGSSKNADKKLARDIAKHGRPLLGTKKATQKLGDDIVKSLKKLSLRGESLMAALRELVGFEIKRFSANGALLKHPSISDSKAKVRLTTLEKHLDNVMICEKEAAEITASKKALDEKILQAEVETTPNKRVKVKKSGYMKKRRSKQRLQDNGPTMG